jgi:tripartite-type tricarboxylate transporter receptor subunit TctC
LIRITNRRFKRKIRKREENMTSMRTLRYAALAIGVAAAPLVAAQPALAEYPEKPIKIVAPFRAGGATHTLTRLVAIELEKTLGAKIVVSAVGGSGGAIGTAQVGRAKPDGYTLVTGSNGTQGIRWQMSNTGYTNESFEALGRIAQVPLGWAARTDSGIETLADLVAHLKANPGTKYASVGTGSSVHILSELWAGNAGLKLIHIANRGGRGAIMKLLSKEVTFIVVSAGNFPSQLKGGKGDLHPLAVSSKGRGKYAPQVPTLQEAGYDFVEYSWWGLFAPKGTPAAVTGKLSAAIEKAINNPKMEQTLKKFYFTPVYASPAETRKILAKNIASATGTLKKLGLYKKK